MADEKEMMAPPSKEEKAMGRDEDKIASMQAQMEAMQAELAERKEAASVVDEVDLGVMEREGRLDETIPGGYYLVGGEMRGGRLVGARAVDANGNPIPARR